MFGLFFLKISNQIANLIKYIKQKLKIKIEKDKLTSPSQLLLMRGDIIKGRMYKKF